MDPTELPLRDLHLPDAIGWWPLALGWWLLIGIFVLACGWLLWREYRRWQFHAPRRHALKAVAEAEQQFLQDGDAARLGRRLSALLRRGMLAYAPRAEVAGLTGESWLAWLDRGMPVPFFHTDGGKSLLELPYRNPQDNFSDVDINALVSAVRMRLSKPPGGTS